jgi:hypothetical protein
MTTSQLLSADAGNDKSHVLQWSDTGSARDHAPGARSKALGPRFELVQLCGRGTCFADRIGMRVE